MHKQAFDLRTGQCLDDADVGVPTYDVKVVRRRSCSSATASRWPREPGRRRPWGRPVMAGPLDGFLIGVTAARKVDEQVALLERRGARVEWAPALSLDPNQVDDEQLRAATREVLARPVDMFLATTGIGMRAWFAAAERVGPARRPARGPGRCRDPGPRPEERRGAAPPGAARAVGPGLGVLRGRARAPARPRPERAADRRPGARPVALDGRARVAPAGRRRHRGHRLPGRRRGRPGADVPDGRPGRGPQARRGHLHLGPGRRRADGRRRRRPGAATRSWRRSRPTWSPPASAR